MTRPCSSHQPSDAAGSPRPWTRGDSAPGVLSLWLGVAPVVLMGGQWLVAWAILGRRPVVWVDDPGMFGPTMDVVAFFTSLSVLLLPAVWPWFAIFWIVRHGKTRAGKVMALANFVLPVASFVILRADPFGITSWWFD